MRRRGIMAVGVTLAATLLTVGLSTPASAAAKPTKGVSPNGCQGVNSTLTLETLARGYNYDCSGYYTNSAGQTAYYLWPGNWSGIIYTTTGNWYFCDLGNGPISGKVIEVYLSATRAPWC